MKMRILAGAAALMISTAAQALPATTNAGHVACLSEQWLSDMVSFSAARDQASFDAYLRQVKCVILKDGMRVTVTGSPGMFGSRAEFVFQGQRFWTTREGLNYGE